MTVGRYADPVEGQMAKGMLEAAGVETFVVGENVNNLMPMAFRVGCRFGWKTRKRRGSCWIAAAASRRMELKKVWKTSNGEV